MNILLIFPGFIVAVIIVLYYERRIRNLSTKIRNLSKKPINKVHFYVARDKLGDLWLYMGKPFRGGTEFYAESNKRVFCLTYSIERFGLKHEDFDSLKWEDEPVEVFLNYEDRSTMIDRNFKIG